MWVSCNRLVKCWQIQLSTTKNAFQSLKWELFLRLALSILLTYHDKFNQALSKDMICKECVSISRKNYFPKKVILQNNM